MIKIIQFLQENKAILELIKENKASLVGITELESQSILCAFEEEICKETLFWG